MTPAERNRSLMLGPTLLRDTVLSVAIGMGKVSPVAVWGGKSGWIGEMLQQVGAK